MNAERLAQDIAALPIHRRDRRRRDRPRRRAAPSVAADSGRREAAAPAETALDFGARAGARAKRELDSLLARLDVEPGRLNEVEERLFALKAAARQIQCPGRQAAALRSDSSQSSIPERRRSIDRAGGADVAAPAQIFRDSCFGAFRGARQSRETSEAIVLSELRR